MTVATVRITGKREDVIEEVARLLLRNFVVLDDTGTHKSRRKYDNFIRYVTVALPPD